MSASEGVRLTNDEEQGAQSSIIPPPSSLLLIGFMGCGKSSIGRRVAKRLRCPFVDLDRDIEAAAGQKIAQIFALQGEEAFRQLETQTLQTALTKMAVIASGGGLVTRPENRVLLAQAAKTGTAIVYLKAEPATLAKRIRRQPGKRPLIDGPNKPLNYPQTKRRVEELLTARRAFYEQCATLTVCTDNREFESVVDEIVSGVASQAAGVGRHEAGGTRHEAGAAAQSGKSNRL